MMCTVEVERDLQCTEASKEKKKKKIDTFMSVLKHNGMLYGVGNMV